MPVRNIGTGDGRGVKVTLAGHRDRSAEPVPFAEAKPGPDPAFKGARVGQASMNDIDPGEGTKTYGTSATSDQRRRGRKFNNYGR